MKHNSIQDLLCSRRPKRSNPDYIRPNNLAIMTICCFVCFIFLFSIFYYCSMFCVVFTCVSTLFIDTLYTREERMKMLNYVPVWGSFKKNKIKTWSQKNKNEVTKKEKGPCELVNVPVSTTLGVLGGPWQVGLWALTMTLYCCPHCRPTTSQSEPLVVQDSTVPSPARASTTHSSTNPSERL